MEEKYAPTNPTNKQEMNVTSKYNEGGWGISVFLCIFAPSVVDPTKPYDATTTFKDT